MLFQIISVYFANIELIMQPVLLLKLHFLIIAAKIDELLCNLFVESCRSSLHLNESQSIYFL